MLKSLPLIAVVACQAIGCRGMPHPSSTRPSADVPVPNVSQWLRRQDVDTLLRERSSATHYSQIWKLSADGTSSANQTKALKLALFHLTSEELFRVGITQVEQSDGLQWSVAWSNDSADVIRAVHAALQTANINGFASCGHGRAGWYVSRDQFFEARTALLTSPEVERLEIQVVTPRLGEP